MKKRVLSVCLSLVMIFSVFSEPVYASGSEIITAESEMNLEANEGEETLENESQTGEENNTLDDSSENNDSVSQNPSSDEEHEKADGNADISEEADAGEKEDESIPGNEENDSTAGDEIGDNEVEETDLPETTEALEINEILADMSDTDERETITVSDTDADFISGDKYKNSFVCDVDISALITNNGDLYCWGENDYGQIGNGTTTDQLKPVKVLGNVASVFPTGNVTGAITKNGDLYCFGRNNNGQIGNGTTTNQARPVKVLDKVRFYDAAFHSIAITVDDDLYCWGFNEDGQVGNGSTLIQTKPVKILSNVKKAITGRYNTFALTNDGKLYIWGYNSYGEIGNGNTASQVKPYKAMDDVEDFFVESNGYFVAAVKKDGGLYVWGQRIYGGYGTKQLVPIKILSDVAFFDISNGHVFCAITNNNDLYCWGDNRKGQVGVGYTSTSWISEPKKILSNICYAIARDYSTWGDSVFAITTEDELYSWGANEGGQLGDGTTTARYSPQKVMNGIKEVQGSGSFIAISSKNEAYTWGRGADGNIGNGSTENSLLPVKVLENVVWVDHAWACFAITSDGTLYGWGYNYYGQIGTGNKNNPTTPYKIMSNLKMEIPSDSCGDDLTWAIEEKDNWTVLNITGKGDMYDFEYAPWYESRNNINKIIIADGVTSIGNAAFKELKNLEEVIIPQSVIKIGDSAFLGCDEGDEDWTILYGSVEKDWNLIAIGNNNEPLHDSLRIEFRHNVIFDLGYGSDSQYIIRTTNFENTVKRPADPEREGYVFYGWAKDNDMKREFVCRNNAGGTEESDSFSIYPFLEDTILHAQWGKITSLDVFSFCNNYDPFCYKNAENGEGYHYEMNAKYWIKFIKEKITPASIILATLLKLKEWAGSCFGMSAVVALKNAGLIKSGNLSKLAELELPINDRGDIDASDLESLINLYHIQQGTFFIGKDKMIDSIIRSESERFKVLINTLKKSQDPVVVNISVSGATNADNTDNHTIVAYGLTTDIKEDKNIYSFKVYDPSAGAKYEYEPRFEYCVKIEEKDGIYSPLKKGAEYSYDELNYFLCAGWGTIKWDNCYSAMMLYGELGFLFDFSVPNIPASVSDDVKIHGRNSCSNTEEEKNEITILRTNYDSFIITNGVESADIVKRNTVSGNLDIRFLGAVGNAIAGSENYQEYLFAILKEENRDIQYIITPKENRDTYTTILYNDSDEGYLASLECNDIGEYIFSNSGTVQTNFTSDTYQAITLARNNTQLIWDGIKLEFEGQGCVAELNNKNANVTPKNNVSIDVTIYEGIDQIEFDSINTSTNGVIVTEKDSSVVIMDKDEIVDSKILKHTIFFDLGDANKNFLVRTVDNGGKLESPEISEREGLVFEGWFKDAKLTEKWNFDEDIVTSSFTLYSKWKDKNQPEDVVPVTEITLNKNTIDIEEGTSFVLTTVVSPSNATDKKVDWISSNADVAIVTDGIVVARSTGTTTITATAGGKSAVCIVTVTEKSSKNPDIDDEKTEYIITASNQAGGSIAPNGDVKVAKGNSQKFIFTADEGYKIDDIKVDGKSIGAVSEYCFENISENHTIEVIFSENPTSTVERITLSQTEVTIKEGATVLLEAIITPSNIVNGQLTWHSSNNDVASVDGEGLVTAKLSGTSIITVTAGEVSASCMVTVVAQGQNEDPGDIDKVVYIITFDLQGHGVGLAEYLNYTNIKPGDKIVEPTSPQDENYKFLGWYKDVECTLPWDFEKDTVQSDITLYAGWQKEDTDGPDDADTEDTDDDTVCPGDLPADGQIPAGLWIANLQDNYLYTGKAIKPAVRVYDHDRRLKAGLDYTVSYKNNTKVNDTSLPSKTPVVVVKGKGDYTGTETAAFNILPVDLNTLTAEHMTVAYNKKEQKKVPVLYYNGKKLSKNRDFTVSWPDQGTDAYKAAGTYRVALTGTGNFTGTKSVQLTITDKNLISKAVVGKIAPLPYTGNAQEPEPTVTLKGAALVRGTDYEVEYTDNISAGTATAILTGINQYAGTKKVNFRITGTSLKGISVTGLEDKEYNGTKQIPSLKVTLNGKSLTEHDDYEISCSKNVNAGKASVTIRGIHAYTGVVKKTFRIVPYDLESMKDQLQGTVVAKYMKGGSKPAPELVFAEKKLTAGKDYTISYKNNKAVTASGGETPVMVIKGRGNFQGTLSKEFTITSKALDDPESLVTLTVADIPFSDKAGKCISKPILTDADGKKLTAGKDYEKAVYTLEDGTLLSNQDKLDAGTEVKVSVKGKGAYTGELKGVYRITVGDFAKARISISAQAYTGREITLKPDDVTVKIGGTLLTCGEDYEIIEESYSNHIKKGKATVTIKGKGNYGGIKTAKFKITARQFVWFWRLFR